MTVEIARFEPTPNPNAVKCILSAPMPEWTGTGGMNFGSAQAAAAHPLAQRLFDIEGVRNVYLMREWLTVNKHPEAEWRSLKPKIRDAVRRWGVSHGC